MISRKKKSPKLVIMPKSVIYPFLLENDSTNHSQCRTLPVSTFHYPNTRNARSFSVTDKSKYFLPPSLRGMEQANSAETFPTFLQGSCLHNFGQNGLNLTHLNLKNKTKQPQIHILKVQVLHPDCHTCL